MEPINRYLDAAVLKPEMTRAEAAEAIRHCAELQTRVVCVRPGDIEQAQKICAGSETAVGAVLAFPHGQQLPASKADEARRYVDLGVAEIDMVVNIGLVRSHDWDAVTADIGAVTAICRPAGVLLKVIFETSYLTQEEIARATECAIAAQADFVKTSTGFSGGGATEESIRTMLQTAAGRVQVKASGGIRDRARAELFLRMGCSRLGVGYSSCEAILRGQGTGAGY